MLEHAYSIFLKTIVACVLVCAAVSIDMHLDQMDGRIDAALHSSQQIEMVAAAIPASVLRGK